MSAGGFEPPTNGLKGHCSAVELRAPTLLRLRCAQSAANGVRKSKPANSSKSEGEFYHVRFAAGTGNAEDNEREASTVESIIRLL